LLLDQAGIFDSAIGITIPETLLATTDEVTE
jgi:hypothetical protein